MDAGGVGTEFALVVSKKPNNAVYPAAAVTLLAVSVVLMVPTVL